MKRIDFTQEGGFPLRQDTLDFMQDGYQEALSAFIAYLGGESTSDSPGMNMIVFGVKEINYGLGSQENPYITPGWIIRNEELLRFSGGSLSDIENAGGIGYEQTTQTATFHDETTPTVYFSKRAVVGGTAPLGLNFYQRAKTQNSYRDIYKIDFQKYVHPINPNGFVRFTYENQVIEKDDVVIIQLKNPQQDTGQLLINAEVVSEGVVYVTLTNHNQNDTVLGGDTIFKARVIK